MKLKIVLSSQTDYEVDSCSKTGYPVKWIPCCFINLRAAHAIVLTLVRPRGISLLKYNVANAAAARKHCKDLEHDKNIDNMSAISFLIILDLESVPFLWCFSKL